MKKLNFAEMGKTLSRSEMKKIMAGSGGCCPTPTKNYNMCSSSTPYPCYCGGAFWGCFSTASDCTSGCGCC